MQRFSKEFERGCFLDIYCIFKEHNFVPRKITQDIKMTEYPY